MRAVFFAPVFFLISFAWAQEGTIPAFKLEVNDLQLTRLAQPGTYFDKVGRKFAILGFESGSFEAWAYPLKLFRNFEFSFFIGSSTEPIKAKDIARFVSVSPEATTLTFTYQSFTLKAVYFTPIGEPGAMTSRHTRSRNRRDPTPAMSARPLRLEYRTRPLTCSLTHPINSKSKSNIQRA